MRNCSAAWIKIELVCYSEILTGVLIKILVFWDVSFSLDPENLGNTAPSKGLQIFDNRTISWNECINLWPDSVFLFGPKFPPSKDQTRNSVLTYAYTCVNKSYIRKINFRHSFPNSCPRAAVDTTLNSGNILLAGVVSKAFRKSNY
jgi:hypothetical protein